MRLSALLTLCFVTLAVLPGTAAAQVISIDKNGISHTYCTTSQNDAAREAAADTTAPPAAYRSMFEQAGRLYKVSPDFLEAVAKQESNYNPQTISPKGAIGIMQLMPATAQAFGVDPHNVRQNIRGGAAYLRYLLDLYDGRIDLALAAYNAGQGAIARYGGVPPFKETQMYLSRNFKYLAHESDMPSPAAVTNPESGYIQICRQQAKGG